MEIHLNLLPPERKKILTHIYLVLYLRFLIEILLFYSLIVAVSLIFANQYLRANLSINQVQTAAADDVYARMNLEIKTVNQQLKNIDAIQSSFVAWSPLMADLLKTISPAITLSGLDFNKDNNEMIIRGAAKTRDELLAFKERLTALDWIKKLEIPVSSLTTKENVNFTINATFSPSAYAPKP